MTESHSRNPAENLADVSRQLLLGSLDGLRAAMLYWTGVVQAQMDFLVPSLKATRAFWETEQADFFTRPLPENLKEYAQLIEENVLLGYTAVLASQNQMVRYHLKEVREFAQAILNTLTAEDRGAVDRYLSELAGTLQSLVADLPHAMREIGPDFGFHFDDPGYRLVAETDRMSLYQVLPDQPGVEVVDEIKPVLILHPSVLGANILAFMPKDRRSLVHCYANQGIPTYVRIIKDIEANRAVQLMTGEDDVRDTQVFARTIKAKHGKPTTISGVCQGGFIAMLGVLSGELDGLVDALILCASPVDGTLSRGLRVFLESVAPRFRTIAYSTRALPDGIRVVDGTVMSWVYKLKSLRYEAPLDFYRRLDAFGRQMRKGRDPVDRMTAAVLRWLVYDRTDLPVEITRLSTLSYSTPITEEGELPIRLFDRSMNLTYLKEKGIALQICYGAQDMLVEPPSSLIAAKFAPAELAEFPKGHAAIMTSWSHPDSEYALHKEFSNGQRGPVRFHLALDGRTPCN